MKSVAADPPAVRFAVRKMMQNRQSEISILLEQAFIAEVRPFVQQTVTAGSIFKLKGRYEMEKAGPSHKPSLFLTALGAVFFWAETFSLDTCVLTPQATPELPLFYSQK
jgi:hypothetical protein